MNLIRTSCVFTGMFALALTGCGSPEPAPTSAVVPADVVKGTVTIEVEMDNRVQSIQVEEVLTGTTLETIMRGMTDPGVVMKGAASTAFVESIGGKATSGGEGWTFLVDGEYSHEGVGTTELSPPTTIRWQFGSFGADSE